ncbi:MAG: aryl-sulfate sulfotransferase [Planctomycetaceae bacterium]|nr:aryl-sulfate sulfotransferase [Planctomycetaceae bacterium]
MSTVTQVPATPTPENSVSQPELEEGTFDRLARLASLLGAGFLCVQFGFLMAVADTPLYRMTRDGIIAAKALWAERSMQAEECPPSLWNLSRYEERGIVRSETAQSFAGYTLYSSGDSAAVVALNNDGEVVHRWDAPFSKVWKTAPHMSRKVPDNAIYIRRFHPFENGDVLALYETTTTTPFGCGLARLDVQGNPIWTFNDHTHHDLDVGDDGRIYVLTQALLLEPHPTFRQIGGAQVEEFVSVVSPDGKELKKISLFDLVGKSGILRGDITSVDLSGDILHSNTVRLVGPGFASHYETVSAGDVMICLRNMNLAVIVNLEKEEIVWATSGPWHLPHDPTPMEDGTILAFDNLFTWGTEIRSRIVQFDPATHELKWSFSGDDKTHPLLSNIRSCQQRLPNGNTLITESDFGRLLEVTLDGEVVWEFVNPVRSKTTPMQTPVVSGAFRYTQDELPFLKPHVPSQVAVKTTSP